MIATATGLAVNQRAAVADAKKNPAARISDWKASNYSFTLQICDDYVSSKERKVPDFVALLAHIGGNAELGANMRLST